MQDYQRAFIDFAINQKVLKFGEFILKSGRKSPYFFNAGLFNTGKSLALLGRFYAQTIKASQIEFDMLYGPAYKGIPLAASVAIAMSDLYDQDIPYAFNRKEVKNHGEGGMIVGSPLKGKVLVIDDVISAGTSVRESVDIIQQANAQTAGVVIALDRQEKGLGETSAIQEVEQQYHLQVASIIQLTHLITYLQSNSNENGLLDKVQQYRQQYGSD